MRMTPTVKVFLYLVTMEDAQAVCDELLWQERYRIEPTRLLTKLQQRQYLVPVLAGFELTDKGREALEDISDWLWIHQYYLPGVIDFTQAKRQMSRGGQTGYQLVTALLDRAQQNAADDPDTLTLLLRQRLKLEFGTRHDQEALHTLMALIYRELDLTTEISEVSLENFNYHTSWVKITPFEKQLLTQLLARMNQTVNDFEMTFSQWLQEASPARRFFTNFEVMTIVMYELGNDRKHLDQVYRNAAQRQRQLLAQQQTSANSAQGIG
ncbi:hypothetical protein [Lacticaseibacillus sp. GG6-2]